jgi:hypothetical protein
MRSVGEEAPERDYGVGWKRRKEIFKRREGGDGYVE